MNFNIPHFTNMSKPSNSSSCSKKRGPMDDYFGTGGSQPDKQPKPFGKLKLKFKL